MCTRSSVAPNPRRITPSDPSRRARRTALRTSRSPSRTKPLRGPTRSRGGREISEGIWPSRGTWARGSRTRRSATSCSETSSRFDPACGVEFLPFRLRREPGLIDAPHPRRAPPIRRRAHDVDRLLEHRGVEDECLELATFPARVDASRLLKAEEISDDAVVPSPAEPARGAAFRRYAREGEVEARLEIVVQDASRPSPVASRRRSRRWNPSLRRTGRPRARPLEGHGGEKASGPDVNLV